MIVIAIPLTDYKHYSALDALGSVCKGDLETRVHITIQTENRSLWTDLEARATVLRSQGVPVEVEYWFDPAAWGGVPATSVEQVRESRIPCVVQARNMSREYALSFSDCEGLYYLDSDVIPPVGSTEILFGLETPLAAGVVYSHDPRCWGIPYVFRKEQDGTIDNHAVMNLPKRGTYDADFVTAGLLLVRRAVLEKQSWRIATVNDPKTTSGYDFAEDPLFCFDAQANGFGKPRVQCDLIAKHHSPDGRWV